MTIMDNRDTTQYSSAVAYDEGLRSYMISVYNYMAIALVVTGVVAYFVGNNAAIMSMIYQTTVMPNGEVYITGTTPLSYVVMFAPLVAVFALGFGINKMSFATAQLVFWGYSALVGLSLASIFLMYELGSIARIFFITASIFGAMSLWGYTTKKDLTGMGSFLIMGLIGVIIASVVNIFLQSSAMQYALSFLTVGIFVGLTAYDTQKIKNLYFQLQGQGEALAKAGLMGALSLYLDFINIFIHLLSLFGDRR